jgi:hypothetical protein
MRFCRQVELIFEAQTLYASKEPCQLCAVDGQPQCLFEAGSRYWPQAINLTSVLEVSCAILDLSRWNKTRLAKRRVCALLDFGASRHAKQTLLNDLLICRCLQNCQGVAKLLLPYNVHKWFAQLPLTARW